MNEFDIKTPDNETVTLYVEELSSIEKHRWTAKAPSELIVENPEDLRTTPDIIDWLVELIVDRTDLTEELIEELDMDEFNRVIEGVAGYAFGSNISMERDNNFSEHDSIEFNDDGSVDLGDWE